MHDSTTKTHRLNWVKGSWLLMCLLFSLASQKSFAMIENNLSCTATGTTGLINLGNVTPSQPLQASMTANCRVTRWFPSGSSLSHTQFYNIGNGPKLYVFTSTQAAQYLSRQSARPPPPVCQAVAYRLGLAPYFLTTYWWLGLPLQNQVFTWSALA